MRAVIHLRALPRDCASSVSLRLAAHVLPPPVSRIRCLDCPARWQRFPCLLRAEGRFHGILHARRPSAGNTGDVRRGSREHDEKERTLGPHLGRESPRSCRREEGNVPVMISLRPSGTDSSPCRSEPGKGKARWVTPGLRREGTSFPVPCAGILFRRVTCAAPGAGTRLRPGGTRRSPRLRRAPAPR